MTVQPMRLLLVNPNSSQSITAALRDTITPFTPSNTTLSFFTPSYGPPGIHDVATAQESCAACMAELIGPKARLDISEYDGVLVSCFSEHPLIAQLRDTLSDLGHNIEVMGMFHAGVASALLRPAPFGIIATGTGEKPNLVVAVATYLGSKESTRFAGVITTGLGVVELQEGDQAKVEKNMRETTGRLVDQGAETLILGCAGMSGMDSMVKDEAMKKGKKVIVVDGARTGVELLVALIRSR
jgi:Asp/Glu/hydantoin racemase